jgi:hypothetical protein
MPSSNLGLQPLGPRLPLILTTVVGLAGTFFIGVAIGQGEFIQVYLLLFAIAALTAIFTMGSKYWLLIPIAFSFNLPAIPFGGRAFELPEITIVLCAVVFAFRYALHTRGVTLFRWSHAAVILYTAWAAFVFVRHPVGLFAMGSSSGGARFYFKIALPLAAFLIVANQNISERDAKWLVRFLIIGSIVGMVVDIVRYKISPPFFANTEEGYYTWHQAMSGPTMMIMLWLFSRYKTREIFGFAKPHLLFLFFFCLAIAAISGKRAGFASVLMTPLVAAILRKEYLYVLTGAILAALLVFILSVGQGSLFRLPLQVQRSLSYLPGKWDWEVRSQFQGGIDPFRKELRDLAWKNIEEHPFVGQGYAVNVHELFALATVGNFNTIGIQAMALGSSWHNTWLGIWADFGFPAVVFWAIFWGQAVVIGFWVYRRTSHGSAFRTLAMMILLYFIGDILRSWTGGHSANDPFTRWWMYGIMLCLAGVLQRQSQSLKTAAPSEKKDPRGAVLAQTLPYR